MHFNRTVTRTILQAYHPALVPLEENLTAAAFPLMKIYPAELCVRRAAEKHLIRPGSLVLESSSGTMALGLAIVCKLYGYRLAVVSDYACDDDLRRRMQELGARVEIVSQPVREGGYQRARLDRLAEIRQETEESWWVSQYDNPDNGRAYAPFAAQLTESLGRVDCLVGTVGSGGSTCGTAGYLRRLFPDIQVVGVDTFASVLFGHPDGPRTLRGLGNSLLPGNLDHTVFDEIHWVTAAEGFAATRLLHQTTTLYRGATSGACWMVARHWAQKHAGKNVVCIFPDCGDRYARTVYDDRYLRENGLFLPELPVEPVEVSHPSEASQHWSFMKWSRRSYLEIAGGSSIAARATGTR